MQPRRVFGRTIDTEPGHGSRDCVGTFRREILLPQPPFKPGEGLFVPYLWPHYVQTKESYSISLAITWKSRAVKRRNSLYLANSLLRRRGFPQAAPGMHRVWDETKILAVQMGALAVEPLRKSERLRKSIRALVLGKRANYYYRNGKAAGTAKAEAS